MSLTRYKESGAVSLFIVIFSALLITTITIGFVRIMLQDQQQATTSDLSRSALDSAQGGVEDAKRAIVTYRSHCIDSSGNVVATTECTTLDRALKNSTTCDTIQKSGILPATFGQKEVIIKQSEADSELQQAYTCVKIQMNTLDFVGSLDPGASRLVPLKANENFNEITVEWYSQSDLQAAISDNGLPANSGIDLSPDLQLPRLADWPKNRPALMRLQLIQFGSSFKLSDFDKNTVGNANTATLFLMPGIAGRSNLSFSDDYTSGALQPVSCDQTFSATSGNGQYACKATIHLPNPIGGNSSNRTAYLRIGTIYNTSTTFRISMAQGSTPVTFNGVQPVVDSTGRANDLFRRIRSRIEVGAGSVPLVDTAVESAGSFCKTFLVTDRAADYNPGSCNP